MTYGVKIAGVFVSSLDSFSNREASDYISFRYDNIPGGCSMSASYYGMLPDCTEERIDAYTAEKMSDSKYYLRNAIRQIEEENETW